ncbi:HD-domain/PDEase-like protein [Basidiobolus meristosporus CBS 931.73]|uniref:Phosphodiesterase n=1 Tax=Basidiobolus meristosporus CBS 931.73 TaxID=1314790 RepID=A0A1Y1Y3N0_9FUNG|nr:HD-domain/PDEase-like protein [Basidiobolus meristosporus CBS 931.73]|eukprot:ORX92204.1 HD-domain/PDEase-like protein [Basidiobolus meristosporus CBS 931.73]
MRLSFLGRSETPPSPTTTSEEEDLAPLNCSILVVDSLFQAGTYHITPYGSPQPSPIKEEYKNVFESGVKTDNHSGLGVSQLLQNLLETYNQVTTFTTGNAAMCSLHEKPGHAGYVILLIDLDNYSQPDVRMSPESDHGIGILDQAARGPHALYGMELLKVVVKEMELGVISNVVPIVVSCNDSPQLMWSCLDLGAADYLVKPVSAQAIKTLWLNTPRGNRSIPWREGKKNVASKSTLEPAERREITPTLNEMLSRSAWMDTIRKRLLSWEFCPHSLSDDDLIRCILIIFEDSLAMEGLKNIQLSTDMMHRFILYVRNSYNDSNPYHNFHHAIDVLQATYYMLKKLGLMGGPSPSSPHSRAVQKFMRPNDVFALIVASLTHDIGHPGVNNTYMINTQNTLALVYNDEAVLENFHAMFLFKMMKEYEIELFPHPSSQEAKDFRKLVINTILATDMTAHFEHIRKISEQNKRLNSQETQGLDLDLERVVFSTAIIKCADISNSARPFSISSKWADSLMHEFSNQARLEASKGHPLIINPHQTEKEWAQSQIDFIKRMSLPLFETVTQGALELADFLHSIHENTVEWERVRDGCTVETDDAKDNPLQQQVPMYWPK